MVIYIYQSLKFYLTNFEPLLKLFIYHTNSNPYTHTLHGSAELFVVSKEMAVIWGNIKG